MYFLKKSIKPIIEKLVCQVLGVHMIPKIAFLFLTVGNIYHESAWVKFFKDHEVQYSLYVHAKKEITPGSFFAPQ